MRSVRPLESFLSEGEVAVEPPEAHRVEEEAGALAPRPADDGLVIEEAELKGFMRYLRVTDPPITFPETFTAITGPTGAGKTTILDAITFALYKRTTRTDLRSVKISEVCREGGYVRVAFRQGGAWYEVKRGIASNGQSYLEVGRDGKPLRGTIPELEGLIQGVVGLDYDGFRNSTFVRQEEMKQLGADSPSQRLEVFQKLFRLETFERAADRAKERGDAVRGRIQEAEGRVAVLRDQVETLPEKRAEVEALAEGVREQEARLAGAEQRLAEVEEAFQELEARHEAFLKAQASLEEHARGLKELEARLAARREALEGLPALREKTDRLAREVASLRDLEAEAEALEEKERRHVLLGKDVEALQGRQRDLEEAFRGRVEALETEREEARRRLDGLSAEMGVDEAFDALREEGGLMERLRRIPRERAWLAEREDLLAQLEAEEAESRAGLEAVRRKTVGITKDTFLFSEIRERLADLEAQRAEAEAEWERRRRELDERREELEAERGATGFGPEETARLAELRERVPRLREAEETLRTAREELQRLEDVEERIREEERERDALRETVETEEVAVTRGREAEAAYREARSRLEHLRRERDAAFRALSEARANHEAAAGRLEELEGLGERLDAVEERLETLRGEAEVLDVLRNGVFHRKGVVMYAVNRLLPELEIETTRNLDDLTDGRLRRVRLETLEEAGTYGIRIAVEGVDGEWHDVGVFSGGERTQINAALRFAIAKELASMPQVGRTYGRMKTLFIDEGDLGSLDTERSRELFVAKLFKMGAFFEKVILVTHLGEVAERFPGRVRVTMTPEGESRAEVVA